jgi:hypothetical protein
MESPSSSSPQAAQILINLGSKTQLGDIAEEFGIKTHRANSQAGQDSLTLGAVFFKIRTLFFHGEIDDKFLSQVHGLAGVGNPASAQQVAAAQFLASNAQQGLNGNAASYTNGTQNVPSTPVTSMATPATVTTPGGSGFGGNGSGTGVFGQFYHKR